jgi:hypothetical protein
MPFATDELINYRKKEAKRLQSEIKKKLVTVQKLVIEKLLIGEDITFEISSYANGANLGYKGMRSGDKNHYICFNHWSHMDYDYDNCICEFYQEQLDIINYWIKILK